MLPAGDRAVADPAIQQPVYWWPAQVSSNGQALTVVFDSSCSIAAPHALVAESATAITIEVLGVQGARCASPPNFGELRIALAHQVGGRAIVGLRADPRLAGGSPVRDVAGVTAHGAPRAPRVVGFDVMDAKLALRMAGLTPHAASSSLNAVVIGERQVSPASRKVLLRTAPRPKLHRAAGGRTSSLGEATPAAASTAPSTASAATSPPATCTNTDLVPNSSNLQQVEAATLCLVNQQRAQAGLALLADEPHLRQAAEQHSIDMVVNNYFSHTTPSGETFSDRLYASGYASPGSGKLGENLAWGTANMATPANMVTAWMNSPEHRANLLDPDYRDTGIGVEPAVPASVSQSPGATYTQEFGVTY